MGRGGRKRSKRGRGHTFLTMQKTRTNWANYPFRPPAQLSISAHTHADMLKQFQKSKRNVSIGARWWKLIVAGVIWWVNSLKKWTSRRRRRKEEEENEEDEISLTAAGSYQRLCLLFFFVFFLNFICELQAKTLLYIINSAPLLWLRRLRRRRMSAAAAV